MIEKYVCMMDGCDYSTQDRLDALDHTRLGHEHAIVEIYPIDDEVKCKLMEESIETEEEEA